MGTRNMIWVIGYGSPLRSDDGAGPEAVRRLAACGLSNVHAKVVHQLLPELCEPLAEARAVFFVDASSEPTDSVTCAPQGPAHGDSSVGHTGDPGWLLALSQALYGRVPPAWLITLPAVSFDFGETLSPVAERGVAEAVALLRERIAVITQGEDGTLDA